DQLVYPGLVEITSLRIEPVLGSCFHCLNRTLFQISVPSISEKGNSHWAKSHEAIRRKRLGMLSDGVILLNGSTILLAKLKNCCESSSGKSGVTPYIPDSAPNLGCKHLSGTRFPSESDVKRVAENWLKTQDIISAKPV
ncbi:hypothetical protein AVEN_19492-1, partial [Araneus ventricosus]